MARAKRQSDELYNARRRVKRLAERYRKAGNSDMANVLTAYVNRSYAAGDVTVEQLNRAYEKAHKPKTQRKKQQTPTAAPTASDTMGAYVDSVTVPTKRTSRPKTAADEVYNARRRLRRQADKLERDAQKATEGIAEQMRSFARELRKAAQTKGKLEDKSRSEELDRLNKIRERTQATVYGKFSETYRRNLILQQQLNAAGVKGADSTISERKKDVFWMSVKGLWTTGEDIPRDERYNRILQAFYLSPNTSTQRDFERWLREKKGIDIEDVSGDLSLVFEYVTTEKNDPEKYEQPETDYEWRKKNVRIVK